MTIEEGREARVMEDRGNCCTGILEHFASLEME